MGELSDWWLVVVAYKERRGLKFHLQKTFGPTFFALLLDWLGGRRGRWEEAGSSQWQL